MNATPFRLDGDERGVLLLHGLAGSPYAMRYLGEMLHRRGFTAWAPLLPGHGGTPQMLAKVAACDWLAAAEEELLTLRATHPRVAVAGLSMGGLLALRLAQKYPDLRAISVLAAPLWLPFHVRTVVGALSKVAAVLGPLPAIPNIGGSDIRDPEARRSYPSPAGFPVGTLADLLVLMKQVRDTLAEVRVPTLVIHGDHDHTAPPAGGREIVQRVATADKKLVRLPRSFHIVTLDVERDTVAAAVGDFFAERI